jgi:hypothetical protein
MSRLFPSAAKALTLAACIVAPALAQTPAKITGNDLTALASGRSWGISYYGDPNDPAMTMVWDFRKDGSVCARSPGGKPGSKCMDEGKWNVRSDAVCWELTWMGEAGGFKSNCFLVKKLKEGLFQLDRQKDPDTKFAEFRVLK